ncbi:hypothetical protein MtrunA17_Chr3g0143141 [Medicago truncatula]|uniref:BAG domain-containing protein n=1 Tax=Medicago truncatula TaxID=3880 RepID=A0A396J1A3_MEDTR|nr:hypothetical protein MtrunA17_Chr3g0143141 [Medicago truncatula]
MSTKLNTFKKSIQGLHPSLREIRKSLARELVTLQEKLDSITVENVQNGEQNQEQQEEKVASEKDSSEGISEGSPKEQLCMKDDDGGSESRSHVDSTSSERTKPTMLPDGLINEDCSPELPVGVLDEYTATFEETNTSENVLSEVSDENEVFIEELPVGVIDEDKATSEETNTSETEVQAGNEVFIEELPVGVLDEDTTTSEKTNTSVNDVQARNEVLINAQINAPENGVNFSHKGSFIKHGGRHRGMWPIRVVDPQNFHGIFIIWGYSG